MLGHGLARECDDAVKWREAVQAYIFGKGKRHVNQTLKVWLDGWRQEDKLGVFAVFQDNASDGI